MSKVMLCLSTVAMLALGAAAGPAKAQQQRSFVSGVGNDNNAPNCTRTAPCRTFQVAHNSTLVNGEITVIDAGSYGAVTITKSISIINDGTGEAGAIVSGGANGITINAGANDVVMLRGLTIKGAIGFGGGNGIVVNRAGAVHIDNCTIGNLDGTGNGILIQPGALLSQSGQFTFTVANTTITDNASSGINVGPGSTVSVTGSLSHVALHNNGFAGLFAGTNVTTNPIDVTVTDSIATHNGAAGSGGNFIAQGPNTIAGEMAALHLVRSVAAYSPSFGLLVINGTAAIFVSESTIRRNAVGASGIFSYGDNLIVDNASGNGPFSPLLSKQ